MPQILCTLVLLCTLALPFARSATPPGTSATPAAPAPAPAATPAR